MKQSAIFICMMAIIVMISSIIFPSIASAVMLDVVGGELRGATGVNVGGTLYDVSFQDGTCIGLFNGCNDVSDFTFQSQSDGLAASQALLDQVFLDGALGNFDTDPTLTRGTEDASRSIIQTPYGLTDPARVILALAENYSVESNDLAGFNETVHISLFDSVFSEDIGWAIWTVNESQIPEPATLVLLASGLVGLGVFRKKFKK